MDQNQFEAALRTGGQLDVATRVMRVIYKRAADDHPTLKKLHDEALTLELALGMLNSYQGMIKDISLICGAIYDQAGASLKDLKDE